MADVGSAYVTLMPSMRGFANDIKAQFGQAGNEGGKSFGSGLGSGISAGSGAAKSALSSIGSAAATAGKLAVAGFTAVTGAVSAIGGAALGAYADYEQLAGGVDTLFGSSASTLKAYADEAYRTAGMSANQYMTQATSFAASLVQSVGGDTAKAAEYANMAMIDMSDNVNKMGSDMQSVQDAYQGFAKQNFTMLDNLKLGYGGTKEEMQRLIADANKLRAEQGKTADLTIESYADIVEAIHTVQEEMGITGTTAKEASTTISGSIGMAKAAWTNFLTGLGRDDVDFSHLTTQLLESIGAVAKNVAPRVAIIGKSIIQAFPSVLSGLGSVLAPIVSEALSTAWNIAVQALAGLGIKLPTVDSSQFMAAFQQVASFVGAAIDGIKGAVSTLASALTPAFAAMQASFAPLIAQVSSVLLPALSVLGSALGNLAAAVLPVISAAIQAIAPVLATVIGAVVSLGTTIATALTPIINNLALLIQTVLPVIQQLFMQWGAAIQAVVSAAFSFIESVVSTVMNVINAVISTVLALINGDWTGVWNGIQSLASAVWNGIGGIVSAGVNLVQTVISSALSLIQSIWNAAWNAVTSFFSSIWEGLKGAARDGIDAVYNTVVGIKDRIVGFFTGAGSWLVESGKAILNGLGEGISAAIGSVTGIVSGAVDKIRSFFPFSPAKEGPFSGHGYTTYSGKALMRDWARGIASGESLVQKTIKSAVGGAGAMFSAGVPMTAAPAAAAIGGNTYITVEGRQQDADQSIKSAVDVIVAAADRASSSRKGW